MRTIKLNHGFFALFMLSLWLPKGVAAKEANLDTIVTKLQANYQTMRDYQADFTQETKIKAYPRPQKSSGKVYYKKPDKMRWDYSKPEKKEIVTDGETLWMHTPSLNQVMKVDFEATSQSKVASAFLSGMGNLKRDFDMTLDKTAEPGKDYRVVLVPKSGAESVKTLILTVDRKSFNIKKTELTDIYDNLTVVILTDFRVNVGFKDARFNFTPPEGVEIFTPPTMH